MTGMSDRSWQDQRSELSAIQGILLATVVGIGFWIFLLGFLFG